MLKRLLIAALAFALLLFIDSRLCGQSPSVIVKTQNNNDGVKAVKKLCNGLTKAGQSCKNQATDISPKCWAHEASAPTCGQPTKAGTPCKRRVKAQGQVCAQHSPSSHIVEDQIIY